MWHGELDSSKLISSSGVENNTFKTIFFRSSVYFLITWSGKLLSMAEVHYVKVLSASELLS